jgi:hypothetical protein
MINAILSLRPNAEFVLRGDTYDGLDWIDTYQTKPTKQEIEFEMARIQGEHDAKEYQRKRAAEYPPMADYIDGVVKGDQAQIDAYIAACQAVKAKYPKP